MRFYIEMKQFSLSLHGTRSSDTEPFFLILISSQYIYFIHHDHWGSCWQCCASVLQILGASPPAGTLSHIVNIGSSRPSIRIELPPPPRTESVGQEVYAETVFSILRSLVSFRYLHFPNAPAPSSAAPPPTRILHSISSSTYPYNSLTRSGNRPIPASRPCTSDPAGAAACSRRRRRISSHPRRDRDRHPHHRSHRAIARSPDFPRTKAVRPGSPPIPSIPFFPVCVCVRDHRPGTRGRSER